MLVHFRTLIHTTTRNNNFPRSHKSTSCLYFLKAPKMASLQSKPKRPTCPVCSKPLRVCLCTRFTSPPLDNSIHVTILQHSLEQKHPLNSTRIAKLGLKNLTVVTVNDVLLDATFKIQLLHDDHALKGSDSEKVMILKDTQMKNLEQNVDFDFAVRNASSCRIFVIGAGVGKGGGVRYIEHPWKEGIQWKKPSFRKFLTFPAARDALAKGFVVRKFQNREMDGGLGLEECEEFELLVPPGSMLLFPTEEAVDLDGLRGMGFEVKNLIVLDGTWAKAMRMYNENPWLKVLPHLRLNLDKMSLYCEVRHQPKEGYLSTIESIAYTMKAAGDDSAGLDNLLDVFEAMVGDQRRCKDERLRKAS